MMRWIFTDDGRRIGLWTGEKFNPSRYYDEERDADFVASVLEGLAELRSIEEAQDEQSSEDKDP